METNHVSLVIRQAAGLSRRASFRSLAGALAIVAAASHTPPAAGAARKRKRCKKIRKEACTACAARERDICEVQIAKESSKVILLARRANLDACLQEVDRICEEEPAQEACFLRVSPCCDTFKTDDITPAITCLLQAQIGQQ